MLLARLVAYRNDGEANSNPSRLDQPASRQGWLLRAIGSLLGKKKT
jgi:hypothetical protein